MFAGMGDLNCDKAIDVLDAVFLINEMSVMAEE